MFSFIDSPNLVRNVIVALALLICIALGFLGLMISSLAYNNCTGIQTLKGYNYTAAVRAEKTLPTLAYYKEHPEELKEQLRQLRLYKAKMKPVNCANYSIPLK